VEEIPIDLVRRVIAKMKKDTAPDDKPGQAMIRKYERLLKQEIMRRKRNG
jgi:hypothetical protein